jgi:hypothetical protein
VVRNRSFAEESILVLYSNDVAVVGADDAPPRTVVVMTLTNDRGDAVTCRYVVDEADHCELAQLEVGEWMLSTEVRHESGALVPVSGPVPLRVVATAPASQQAQDGSVDTGNSSVPSLPIDASESIALLAALLTLAALQRRQSSALQRLDSDEREESEVASFSAGTGSGGLDQRRDVYRPPSIDRIDIGLRDAAWKTAPLSPALGRSLDDGSYLRGLIGLFWPAIVAAGAVLGSLAAMNTDGIVALPALWIVVALVIVGTFDALAGLAAAVSYLVTVVILGGLTGADAIRGYLGLAALMILVGLVASAVRPYRRESVQDHIWNRTVDFVLISLLGAWTAGLIFRAIPHLSGYSTPWADRVGVVELSALTALALRFGLENVARLTVSQRLRRIENEILPEPGDAQKTVSRIVRTMVFAFIAVVFVGMNWWLVAGAVMYLAPKLLEPVTNYLPNSPALHKFLPRRLVRIVAMLLVMKWWSSMVMDGVAENRVQWAFVLMSVPGLILNVADWFARSGGKWRSTPMSRLAGAGVLIVGILIARGYWL